MTAAGLQNLRSASPSHRAVVRCLRRRNGLVRFLLGQARYLQTPLIAVLDRRPRMKKIMPGVVAALTLSMAGPALAHITLAQTEAAEGSTYKGVLQVGHGCEGQATTSVRIQIPEGVTAVKPMPKWGWELETKIEPYDKPITHLDQTLTEGVREIAWTGGRLPDDWYDEFIFRATLPDGELGSVIHFPVVQGCGDEVIRWIEVPAQGQDAHGLPEPAPGVTLTPATSHHH
jgi:periplasmic copper chaperone A